MYFRYFVIISPWKQTWPFILTNLNPLHPRTLCANFGWNWSSGSWEEDINGKSLHTDRRTTENRWSEKLTWAFSSGELRKNKNKKTLERKTRHSMPRSHSLVNIFLLWSNISYYILNRSVIRFFCMVAYSCHHLSDIILMTSDIYVDLQVIYVNLPYHYVNRKNHDY